MNIVLDGGTGAIVSADLGPAFVPPVPPPTGYTFYFTGFVHGVPNIPSDVPVAVNDTFQGSFTYVPSSLVSGGAGNYLPASDGSTIASQGVTYYRGTTEMMSFQSNTIDGILIYNNFGATYGTPPNETYADVDLVRLDYSMSSTPQIITTPIKSTLIIRDEAPDDPDALPDALNSLDIPTYLNLADWNSNKTFTMFFGTGTSSWIGGTLETLTSASPSPPITLASPTVQQSAAVPEWCVGSPPIELITSTSVCKDCADNGDGTFNCEAEGATCETKTAVERNIMEKSGDGSTYCYYDKMGRRVCKTI
jgi:hypothetical protein